MVYKDVNGLGSANCVISAGNADVRPIKHSAHQQTKNAMPGKTCAKISPQPDRPRPLQHQSGGRCIWGIGGPGQLLLPAQEARPSHVSHRSRERPASHQLTLATTADINSNTKLSQRNNGDANNCNN